MVKICVPVCVRRIDELPAATERAALLADIVELRLDYLEEPTAALPMLRQLIDEIQSELILTMRAAQQGGANSHTDEERLKFWSEAKDLPGVLYDLELDFLEHHTNLEIDRSRVIVSHHDFLGVPHEMDGLLARMKATNARVSKIAVQANDATDCIPVLKLLDRAKQAGRELIAIAMGEAGVLSRILGPSRGSFLTYGSSQAESATAPGQLPAKDLRKLFRIDQIDSRTQILGVIGKPISHSLSPQIHNAVLAAANLNAVYVPIEVADAATFMQQMAHPVTRKLDWNLRGLSVTAPHKTAVMKFLDFIDPLAMEIGAVNTIVADGNRLLGYNTDARGFIEPLRTKLGDLRGVRCAVIGSGGAARAVLSALRHAGAEATLVARNRERANGLAIRFKAACPPQRPETFRDFEVVINATPIGTRGPTMGQTPALAEQLAGVRLAYDLVYNPTETRFLREARKAGCDTFGGMEMLLEQAAEQFKLWMGSEPDRKVMRAVALEASIDSSRIK